MTKAFLLILTAGLAASSTEASVHFQTLKSFYTFGANPRTPLVRGSDGRFYGTTAFGGDKGLGSVFKLNGDGTSYALVHSFAETDDGGLRPVAGLVEGTDGALYGTASEGGRGNRGTIFKMNKDGSGFAV